MRVRKRESSVPASVYDLAVREAALYKAKWLEEHRRRYELAKEHSQIEISEAHPAEANGHTTFFCSKCRIMWPCPTFRWASGKEFEPLRLKRAEPKGEEK